MAVRTAGRHIRVGLVRASNLAVASVAVVGGLAILVAAAFVVPTAAAEPRRVVDRYRVSATAGDVDYGNRDTRAGVIVANRPGGLYMGRLFPAEEFGVVDPRYESDKGSHYFPATIGDTGFCAWVGPSNGVPAATAYYERVDDVAGAVTSEAGEEVATGASGASTTRREGCDRERTAWLHERLNAGTIYEDVNCPLPSEPWSESIATWGGYTHTTQPTHVFYNADWRWDNGGYAAAPKGGPIATLPAGSGVYYRYTARGGVLAAVFIDGRSGGHGWAFIDAASVPKVKYWSRPERSPDYTAIPCDASEDPGTPVLPPAAIQALAWLVGLPAR